MGTARFHQLVDENIIHDIETFTKLRHNVIGDLSMGKSMLMFDDVSFSLTSKPTLLRRFLDFFKCKRNPTRWYHYKTVIADYRKSQKGTTNIIKGNAK